LEFRPALQSWLEHRTAQGHKIAIISNLRSAKDISAAIHATAAKGNLRFVVLIGDDEPEATASEAVRVRSTPTQLTKAIVNVRWGSEPHIATDNQFADLDNDQLPDVAIGRLTADSVDELKTIVEKIIAYEKSQDFGLWRQRINVVAGVGGFGPLADSLMETATKKFLTDGIPSAYTTTMTYASWRSPYCPDPRRFRDTTLRRLDEGSLFWIYIGHGQHTSLDRVHTPLAEYPILSTNDIHELKGDAPPIAVFLSCYAGAFDYLHDCLAEELLAIKGGPVAVFSGSRVTMPYAMAVMSSGMMDEYFRKRRATIGELILQAKRRMMEEFDENDSTRNDLYAQNRRLLDSLAAAISPAPELLAEERLEHVQLFNLLGDPLMRLHHPQQIDVTAEKSISAGETLDILADVPLAGKCRVEFVCRRDRMKRPSVTRSQFEAAEAWLEAFNQTYQQANDQQWVVREFDVQPGKVTTTLAIPEQARGACHVRVSVSGATSLALGTADVFVKRPRATAAE
jgi:hypothetical protein